MDNKKNLYVLLQVSKISGCGYNILISKINEGNKYEIDAYLKAKCKVLEYFIRNNYHIEFLPHGKSFNVYKELKQDRKMINNIRKIINSEFRFLPGYVVGL